MVNIMHQLDLFTAFLYWIPTIVILIIMIAILSTSFWRFRKKHEKRRQIQREYIERAFSAKRPRIGALRCYTHATKVTDMMQSFSASEINRILHSYKNESGSLTIACVPEEEEDTTKHTDDSSPRKYWSESCDATPRDLPNHDDLFYENRTAFATKRTKDSLDFDECPGILMDLPARKRKRKKKKNRFLSKSKHEEDVTQTENIGPMIANDILPSRSLQRSKTLPEWSNEAVPLNTPNSQFINLRVTDAWRENDCLNGPDMTSTDHTGYLSNVMATASGDLSTGCYENMKSAKNNRGHKETDMVTLKSETLTVHQNNENGNKEKVFWVDTSDIQQSSV